jgi:hypothetical protein
MDKAYTSGPMERLTLGSTRMGLSMEKGYSSTMTVGSMTVTGLRGSRMEREFLKARVECTNEGYGRMEDLFANSLLADNLLT